MIFKDKNGINTIDTLLYFPIFTSSLNAAHLTDNQVVNHWKLNNSTTYIDLTEEKNISIYNEDGSEKNAKEIYDMLSSWENESIFNAFFNHDLEAGNIKGGGEGIVKIIIKRLSPETNYSIFETIGEVPYSKEYQKIGYKDYLIYSGQVYLYSIQPVTENNHYGALQNKQPGLNRYEYSWLIDSDGSQIEILGSNISNVSIHTKDGVVETIGGTVPFVNRFSNLDYRTFTLTGTIAVIGDFENHITPIVDTMVYSDKEDIQNIIKNKFIEKTGNVPNVMSNSMRIDYNYERIFREKIVSILKNGHPKIFKSPTEGLMIVKLTNVSLTPKTALNRIIYDFSATVTEVGQFNTESYKNFKMNEAITIE